MHSQDLGHSRARQAAATEHDAGRADGYWRCASRPSRSASPAGAGRGEGGRGRRRHSDRQSRRHPRGDRSQRSGELPPHQPRPAAAAGDRSARSRLDRRRRCVQGGRTGPGLPSGGPNPAFPASSSIAQPFEIDRMFELPPAAHGHRMVTDLIEAAGQWPAPARERRRSRRGSAELPERCHGGGAAAGSQAVAAGAERIIVIDPGHGGVDPGAIGSATRFSRRTSLCARASPCATGSRRPAATR